jgi:hypothetical protein
MLIDETRNNGWQRQWHPSSDLHRPPGYTLIRAATLGICAPNRLGLDASAVTFDARFEI